LLEPVEKWSNYTAFGSPMPGRSYFGSSPYRYGMNGQENDDEITGNHGTHTSAEFWEYDTRTGRRWNIDPVLATWESPYACFANNPIRYSDVNGDTPGDKDKDKATVKNEPAGQVNVVQPQQSITGGGVSNGTMPTAVPTGGAGSQATPQNTTETFPLYVDNAPLQNRYGSQNLYAAAPSNTQNYYYQVSTSQPGRLAGVNLPGTEITVGVGPVSCNIMTGEIGLTATNKKGYSMGVNPVSVGKGNFSAGANGVSYMGNTAGASGYSETMTYYVMDGKTTALSRVDKTIVYSQVNIIVAQSNNIKVTKTTTPVGGVSTVETTVDTTIISGGVSGSTGGYSGGFMTPLFGKSNLKPQAPVNPFLLK